VDEGAGMLTWIAKRLAAWFIRKHWGRRCEYVDILCPPCKAWLMYDYLFGSRWMRDDVVTGRVQVDIAVPADTNWDTPDGKATEEA